MKAEFQALNRDYYSNEAYEEIIEIMNSIDEDYELDVIEICGDFTEYEPDDLIDEYGDEYPLQDLLNLKDYRGCDDKVEEDYLEALVDKISDEYCVSELPNGNYLLY